MDPSTAATELFKRLETSALIELSLILVTGLVLILAEQRVLPWIANRLHGRTRHYLLASVPLLRLTIIVVTVVIAP